MSNLAKSAQRSSITRRAHSQTGAAGFHRAPGDFSDLVGMRDSSQQTYVRKNWHYMTPGRERHAESLSSKFVTLAGVEIPVDIKSGQFGLALA